MRLVLAGAAVSALLAALSQGIALYFDVAQDIMFWTVGGVAGSNWTQIKIIAPWILGALLGATVLSRAISLLSLGEDVAKGLGLNIVLVKVLCSAVVLMLAGASVTVVGAVGFVGLMVPHLARFLIGLDYRRIIPTSVVLGALLMVLADLGARTLNPPFETPIGAIIALAGVPFFLALALAKEFQGRSYNMMVAHTAIVFMRYAMLSLKSRNSSDNRILGDLLYYFCDEAKDTKFAASLSLIPDLLKKVLNNNPVISEDVMHEILNVFINGLPLIWKKKLRLSV